MKGKQNAYSLQQNKKFVLDKGYSLFSNELGKKERLIKLENEFDISIDNDLKEEVEEMCNLGQGILERGEARGRPVHPRANP